jgi:hypothetical protein
MNEEETTKPTRARTPNNKHDDRLSYLGCLVGGIAAPLVVLLLAAACVPVPQSSLPPAPVPPGPAPTFVGTAAESPAGPTVEATVPASATPEQTAADGWQTYTNTEAGFSIRYPPDWSVTPSPPATPEPEMHVDVLEGPEGRIELDWGQGFGGACYAYSALHLAQGQIPVCYYVASDGIPHWSLDAVKLPTVGVAGFAQTKDTEPASADLVLAILATLTFEVPEGLPTAAPPAAPGPPQEIVVDNADASFWPVGNWYFLNTGQQYGKDCYVALPGLSTAAEVRPDLPEAGSYEVYAWWCGDPHQDQSDNGIIEVHRSAGDPAPQAVAVNYQANAGSWQSLGVYDLKPGAFLNVKSVLDGKVVADAFRFVYRSPANGEEAPTPAPTATTVVSHYPPAPWQQLSSGDLARRLDLTGDIYASVPMTATHVRFDDCQAFPRDGCGGTQDGWQAIVGYETITLTYRVSDDYKLVAIDGSDEKLDPWLMGQDHPQRIFLQGNVGGSDFSVTYYPDNTWHLLRPGDGSMSESDVILTQDQADTLQTLAPKYSSLYLRTTDGEELVFYGLGPVVAPSDADRDMLLALGAALTAEPP